MTGAGAMVNGCRHCQPGRQAGGRRRPLPLTVTLPTGTCLKNVLRALTRWRGLLVA